MREALNHGDRPPGQSSVRSWRATACRPATSCPRPPSRHRRRTPHARSRYDPAAARRLLVEAGYPDGFAITLGTPSGRYLDDLKVAQAIAATWTRMERQDPGRGNRAAESSSKDRDELKYSAYLAGWGAESGEMSNPLRALAATPSREKGMGGTNRGRYSNPAMDAKLEEAMRTVDDKKREALLQARAGW